MKAVLSYLEKNNFPINYTDHFKEKFRLEIEKSSENKGSTTGKQTSTDSKKTSSIPNTKIHPQIIGQQVPETYNTIRYTQEGATSRSIIENELKGDISNFTNEEIDAAIASYNAKNQG